MTDKQNRFYELVQNDFNVSCKANGGFVLTSSRYDSTTGSESYEAAFSNFDDMVTWLGTALFHEKEQDG